MQKLHIETVTADNVDELGFFCIGSKKHPGYVAKRAWLEKRFEEGLRITLLHTAEGKPAGFIEYVPGAYTWRTIEKADAYMVIQFMKNGFAIADSASPGYQLLLSRPEATAENGEGETPHFPTDWKQRLAQFEGLHILYTMQCPYTGKIVRELPDVARRHDIVLNLWEIDDPAEAREIMPSPYGTFALIHNGRLIEDHPISTTRFRNILQRDLKLSETSL